MSAINRKVSLQFDGETYDIPADFSVIEQIEQRLGLGTLSSRLMEGDVRVSDLAWVVFSSLKSIGEDVSYQECGNFVLRSGVADAAEFVGKLVEEALGAGPAEPLGDEDAPKRPAVKRKK